MCFSASVSFAASGGLAVIGVASFRLANRKQKLIAAIPFFFAIQQAFEGFQWITVSSGQVSIMAAYGFMFFALLLWPLYIPVTVFVLDKKRRKVLQWIVGIGVALTLYYFILLLLEPIGVHVFDRSIHYQINTPFGIAVGILYFVAVCGALLLSSKWAFRWGGIAVFVSAILTAVFSFATFASVWCFFAALLSSLIYFYLKYPQQMIK